MSTIIANPYTLITAGMLLGIISLWPFPFPRLGLTLILLFFSVVCALVSVILKHRAARLLGRITFLIFLRNVLLEIIFVMSVMLLAGILGRYSAQLTTQQIGHDFLRFVAGMFTALLVGIGVGVAMHLILGRFTKAPVDN